MLVRIDCKNLPGTNTCLLQKLVNYRQKSFITLVPGVNLIKNVELIICALGVLIYVPDSGVPFCPNLTLMVKVGSYLSVANWQYYTQSTFLEGERVARVKHASLSCQRVNYFCKKFSNKML